MATPLGHSMMGVAIYLVTVRSSEWSRRWGWLLLVVLFSAFADIDYFPALFGRLGLANSLHRGITHTVLFAAGTTTLYLVVAGALRRKLMWKPALILLVAYLIHLILDIFAEDGKAPYGIAPFYPFSRTYYYGFWPVFPKIHKATWTEVFSFNNVRVALFEIVVFGILIAIVLALRLLIDRRQKHHA